MSGRIIRETEKWIVRLILLVLLFFSLATAGAGIVNFFVVAPSAFYILVLIYSFLPESTKKRLKSKKAVSFLLSFIAVCIVIAVIIVSVLGGMMIVSANNAPESDNATVIVLGCQVHADGNPSVMLCRRINAAYGYLSDHPDSKCVATGGRGQGENESEGAVIKRCLVEMGIDADRIYTDELSKNTYQNIVFARDIIDANGLNTDAVIASDGFHQLRAQNIAKNAGLNPSAFNAVTPWYLAETMVLREMAANVKCLIFGY